MKLTRTSALGCLAGAAAVAVAGTAAPGCFSTFPSDCGDGRVGPGEQCDDGNRFAGDGCSPSCRIELVSVLCGNGRVDAGEDCEPPGAQGCGADCLWSAVCGDGIVEPGEACDPPNTVDCTWDCRAGGPMQPVGSPCAFDGDCGAPDNPALTSLCLNSADFPGGMCVLLYCTDFGSGSDCPTGAQCLTLPDGSGGAVNVCAPSCTPVGTGPGDCRADETMDGAYACYPSITGGAGVCWAGCATAAQCNDPTVAPSEWQYGCNDANNRCYALGTPGAAVGDPCLADSDCTEGGSCLSGDWTGDGTDDWPGGYCSKLGCAAYAGNPVWDCPAGSACAALDTPWQSVLPLDLCMADCTGDGANGTCARPDDYECMDFQDLAGAMADGVAPAGAAGWCFQCELEHVVDGVDPATCPL
ncbi:MAG TPA: hypothetical protein VG389_15525 [Myxococcota bacterium]|jgi:cysteine-rich repeat protein|nr:hypothetical protein [Myxococcota bacterium]